MLFTKGRQKHPDSGRKKGQATKATADIKKLAHSHCPEAIAILVGLMRSAKMEATRVAAAKEVMDRGIGKAAQPITGANEGPIETKLIVSWLRHDDERTADQVNADNATRRAAAGLPAFH
jgi:hypothetical protein